LGINVRKYYSEGECGWDEGLDVNCFVDGKELLALRRDGSDDDYDTQSLNRGLLHQLAAQLLVPAVESLAILTLLWQILCAPLLACGRWDEEKPRLGLSLPHRKDDPQIFRTLGTMLSKLVELHNKEFGGALSPTVQSRREDADTFCFLTCVLDK
jgi:hypothetical protein